MSWSDAASFSAAGNDPGRHFVAPPHEADPRISLDEPNLTNCLEYRNGESEAEHTVSAVARCTCTKVHPATACADNVHCKIDAGAACARAPARRHACVDAAAHAASERQQAAAGEDAGRALRAATATIYIALHGRLVRLRPPPGHPGCGRAGRARCTCRKQRRHAEGSWTFLES